MIPTAQSFGRVSPRPPRQNPARGIVEFGWGRPPPIARAPAATYFIARSALTSTKTLVFPLRRFMIRTKIRDKPSSWAVRADSGLRAPFARNVSMIARILSPPKPSSSSGAGGAGEGTGTDGATAGAGVGGRGGTGAGSCDGRVGPTTGVGETTATGAGGVIESSLTVCAAALPTGIV